jgi:hypothetical protein
MTEEQARELITRLLGASRPIDLFPFEFGWIAQRKLSAEERSQGRHVGQGSYIIDQNGVITVQSSLPIPLVVKKYTEARREGRITGRQVWPEPNQPA